MRQLILSPRWIVWHLLTLGAMATCGWLAAWQWGRAGSAMGSALNVGYGLQWPVFAVFFGVMWWRMLRMEAAKLREETEAAVQESGTALPAPQPDGSDAAEPPTAMPPTAMTAAATSGAATTGAATPGPAPSDPGSLPDRPSPFGPRPAWAEAASAEDDPELAAYNRMLARLAAHDSEH